MKTTICGIPVEIRTLADSTEIQPAVTDSFTSTHERLITNWLRHKGNVVLAVRDTIVVPHKLCPGSVPVSNK